MKKVLSLSVMALCLSANADVEKQEFAASEIRKVSVENASGKVMVTATAEPKATVSVNKRKFGSRCQLKTEKEGSHLKIEVKKTGWFGSDCEADIEVNIAKLVDVSVQAGFGNVRVVGTSGTLQFKIGSGDLHADGVFEKIEGKVGNGSVVVNGLTGGGDVKLGNGSSDLTYAAAPLKGNLEIKTGNGNSTLSFPRGSQIRSELKAAMGSYKDELGSNPDAQFKVSASAGTGDLTIKAF